jgi:alkanesulfonate monooxygenase SsuD/methylene tetrahydromethanopterin reductase-like flavin-dependent oxidoreductase (luciferase family)
LWSEDPVTFRTRHIAAEIAEMRMQPPPVAPIPIWAGGGSPAAQARATRLCDGWHGTRLSPEQAAPVVQRLRSERPEPGFAISLRIGWDGKDAGELRQRLAAYAEAGIGHILAEPAERELDTWLRRVEQIARAGEAFVSIG